MVEKTQSAITILQQRQHEVTNLRTTEELVAEVQARASLAILEVKQEAMEQIRQAVGERRRSQGIVENGKEGKEEVSGEWQSNDDDDDNFSDDDDDDDENEDDANENKDDADGHNE